MAASRLLGVFLLILMVGCAAERQPLYSAPALWRIETQVGDIWLFPTLHFLPPESAPRRARSAYQARRSSNLAQGQGWKWGQVRRALREAHGLVVETSDTHSAQELRGMIDEIDGGADQSPLRRRVDDEQWARVADALQQRGLTGTGIEAFSAEQVLLLLYLMPTTSNLRLDPGVDRVLMRYADRQRLDILALETTTSRLAQVLSTFRSLEDDRQFRLITSYARATGRNEASVDTLFNDWQAGNLEPMTGSLTRMAEHFPELYDAIFRLRNRLWVDQILAYQERHPNLFVAVGAGHFAGPDNLIDLLHERGLAIERVQ